MTPVGKIQSILGKEPVLLFCAANKKFPKSKGWQQTPASVMQAESHLMFLATAPGIAVLLGEVSVGLITIDCDEQPFLDDLLALNPRLKTTTLTKRKRGGNLWLKIVGEIPETKKLIKVWDNGEESDVGEIRSNGSVTMIHGTIQDTKKAETEPSSYQFLNDASPIEMEFSEIQWPDYLAKEEEPEEDHFGKLVEAYGHAFNFAKDGKVVSLNYRFFAAQFAQENLIVWNQKLRSFESYVAGMGIWSMIEEVEIRERLAQRLQEISRETGLGFGSKLSQSKIKEIYEFLKGIAVEAPREAAKAIALTNGVIRLENSAAFFTPHSPDYQLRNQIPIKFDPVARCPRFLGELLGRNLSADDIVLFQKYFGMCLLGRNFAQKILILHGEGGAGKSTVLRVTESIVGKLNRYQLRTNHLDDRFELFRFMGKTLLLGVDVPGDFMMAKGVNTLKALVGGDPLTPEAKCSNTSFEMEGIFNVILTTNCDLRVRLDGDKSAWKRRLLIIEYLNTPVAKKIPDFDRILIQEEGSGILNWGIQGLLSLQKDYRETGDFPLSETQKERVEKFLAASESVRRYVLERIERSTGLELTTTEIMEGYAIFCSDHQWTPVIETEARSQLRKLMLEIHTTSETRSLIREGRDVRGYRNIGFVI